MKTVENCLKKVERIAGLKIVKFKNKAKAIIQQIEHLNKENSFKFLMNESGTINSLKQSTPVYVIKNENVEYDFRKPLTLNQTNPLNITKQTSNIKCSEELNPTIYAIKKEKSDYSFRKPLSSIKIINGTIKKSEEFTPNIFSIKKEKNDCPFRKPLSSIKTNNGTIKGSEESTPMMIHAINKEKNVYGFGKPLNLNKLINGTIAGSEESTPMIYAINKEQNNYEFRKPLILNKTNQLKVINKNIKNEVVPSNIKIKQEFKRPKVKKNILTPIHTAQLPKNTFKIKKYLSSMKNIVVNKNPTEIIEKINKTQINKPQNNINEESISEEIYICPICDKHFYNETIFLKHINEYHTKQECLNKSETIKERDILFKPKINELILKPSVNIKEHPQSKLNKILIQKPKSNYHEQPDKIIDVLNEIPIIESQEELNQPKMEKLKFKLQKMEENFNQDIQNTTDEDLIYECPLCEETFFKKKSFFLTHIKKFHTKFKNITEKLLMKMRIEKLQECNDDASEYKIDNEFQNIFVCSLCDEKFKSKTNLQKHRAEFHKKIIKGGVMSMKKNRKKIDPSKKLIINDKNEEEFIYECQLCDETFQQRMHFLKHKNDDHSKYQCIEKTCQKKFFCKYSYKRHLEIHTIKQFVLVKTSTVEV